MKILVIGGDGFCGWPVALKFALHHDVVIWDSLFRRRTDFISGSSSLTQISSIEGRIQAWNEGTWGNKIEYNRVDITDQTRLTFSRVNPDVVIHLGEQRSAPYSMTGLDQKIETVTNNVTGTHNLLATLASLDFEGHFVHLGSIGVYGYNHVGDGPIPEGSAMHDPGSVYHLTKAMDQQMMEFYSKVHGMRITELHQGIVWGTQTAETQLHPNLVNRFDYDSNYGTVVNRFITQGVCGMDLTVYGDGRQTRALININDTVDLIHQFALAPSTGFNVINQITETATVGEIAALVSARTGAKIDYINNPRFEKAANTLPMTNPTVRTAKPNYRSLADHIGDEIYLVDQLRQHIDPRHIHPSAWK